MIGRVLHFIFGVIVFLCSTPAGTAQEAVLEESRAVFSVSAEMRDGGRGAVLTLEDLALLPGAELSVETEENVEGGRQVKRHVKRTTAHARFVSKLRFSSALSPEMQARGVARHPRTQDARQELTQTIRLLHLASLAC